MKQEKSLDKCQSTISYHPNLPLYHHPLHSRHWIQPKTALTIKANFQDKKSSCRQWKILKTYCLFLLLFQTRECTFLSIRNCKEEKDKSFENVTAIQYSWKGKHCKVINGSLKLPARFSVFSANLSTESLEESRTTTFFFFFFLVRSKGTICRKRIKPENCQ